MSKVMPTEASLGSEFMAELRLVAQNCAANVVVRDLLPGNASFVRSEPEASVEGNELVWKFGNLDAGQTITARVWLRADSEGTIVNCSTVSADPRVCASTFVGKPVLAIDKTGPGTATIGSDVTYEIVVRNVGSSIARDVVVTDPVPEGFSHSTGQRELSFNVGDLAPGQASKPISVTFRANERGTICNVATASSSNAASVNDDACTTIQAPGLKVEKSGTESQILGRNANYSIVVTNTGDTALTNVVVTDTAPSQTSIVNASGAKVSGNQATWTIAQIQPGDSQTLSLTLTSQIAGTHCNQVTASSGNLSDSAQACTLWRGIAAVLLEVVDDPDPIQIGESTTYTIKVTNQGFADIHDVKVVATFDDEVTPTASAQGSISGKTVDFPAIASLAAKQVVTYTITVQGANVGDARNKVVLTVEELKSPVEETESTTVY